MRIFITGASGFVGSHILQRLKGQHEFYAMARSQSSADKVAALGATPVMCDLGNVKPKHLNNCDAIIHAAAFTKEWGKKSEFWEPTVNGTKQLLEVAKASGIKKFLHISTEALLFTGQDLQDIDESYPYPEKSKFNYSETKLEAEKAVLAANEPGKFEVMVLRPRFVWGPNDQTVLKVLVEMVQQGKFMWVNGGINKTSTVHIYNVVEGVRCALENWKAGSLYFITDGEISTYKSFLTQYIETQGVTPPDKSISKGLARFAADTCEFIWNTLGIKSKPPVTKLAAYMMSSDFTISHEKATKEINYKPIIDIKTGMEELSSSPK